MRLGPSEQMTGNSPKHRATANLVPIAPSPVHPPSPILLPALQDRADIYFNMPLASTDPIPSATNTMGGATVTVPIIAHNHQLSGDLQKTSTGLEGTKEEGAINDAHERANTVSTSNNSGPDITGAEKDAFESNRSTTSPDTSANANHQIDAAISANETSTSSLSQIPPDISGPFISDRDKAERPQPSSEQLPANNDDRSSSTNFVSSPATTVQALDNNKASHATLATLADITKLHDPNSLPNNNALQQSIILPSKPPVPDPAPIQSYLPTNNYAFQSNDMHFLPSSVTATGYYAGAGSRTMEPYTGITPIPGVIPLPNHINAITQSDAAYGAFPADQPATNGHQQQWDAFLQEERKYVAEGRWDRFPEGSRIFIGNLSSERVSKNEVFELFSKYGRLAQISLKLAYGFVQYHTVAEGNAAMDNLQGIELKGKKINLEFSRTQKKDGEGHRANKVKRDSGRQDSNRGRRDDYRPGRQPSPRHSTPKIPSYDNDKRVRNYRENSYSNERRRSQSPQRSRDMYTRRSPTPDRRYAPSSDVDIPYRHGEEIPDIQFLVLQGVKRDFISWAQGAFVNMGLKVDVMFLSPQFPRDAVIQRQILEGVHAVAELNFHGQEQGKIHLQVFNRSDGHNVRFDQYNDLEPTVAAQLVVRAKSQSQGPPPVYYNNQYQPPQHYQPQQYPPQRYPPQQYPTQQYPTQQYPAQQYPAQQYPAQQYPPQQYPPPTQGQYMPPPYPNPNFHAPVTPGTGGAPLDSNAVNKILGSLNGQPTGMHTYAGGSRDVNTLLATLSTDHHGMGSSSAAHNGTRGHPPAQHGMGYTPSAHNVSTGAPNAGSSARHVEDIMTQLARYRQ